MRSLFLASVALAALLWAAPAPAATIEEVVQWTASQVSEKEQLKRLRAEKTVQRPSIYQIAQMRLTGVPASVIDFMVNFKAVDGGAPTSYPGDAWEPAPAPESSPSVVQPASSERLTVGLAIRLAHEHRLSLSAFEAALAATRGQLEINFETARMLVRSNVTAEQIAALTRHNPHALCRYTRDCVSRARCSAQRCIRIVEAETTPRMAIVEAETTPRFGHGFIMGGLGLTRSTGVSPATDGSAAEEETVWGVDLALRLAYVTPAGIYIGGRAWYDSALADGDGDGSGALLFGYLARLSERHPLFLDVRGDVSSVNDEITVSAGLGLAVALGEEHPIFLHTELVSIESGGASSRGNVSMGVRF